MLEKFHGMNTIHTFLIKEEQLLNANRDLFSNYILKKVVCPRTQITAP